MTRSRLAALAALAWVCFLCACLGLGVLVAVRVAEAITAFHP